ncbi:hypothetical protein GQ44DRAFT_719307 [Phaeosphaeriaceae sp. PMI808]|nr:hypothetical protein GQ44DRAFT_719307 [Phaeosphaeriaceae sp. PMI808]
MTISRPKTPGCQFVFNQAADRREAISSLLPESALPSTGRRPLVPLQTLAKKKQAVIWQCCSCGRSSIPIRTGTCPHCGTPRCINCQMTRVLV